MANGSERRAESTQSVLETEKRSVLQRLYDKIAYWKVCMELLFTSDGPSPKKRDRRDDYAHLEVMRLEERICMDGTGVYAPPPEPIDIVPQEIRFLDVNGEYLQAADVQTSPQTSQYQFVIDPAMLDTLTTEQAAHIQELTQEIASLQEQIATYGPDARMGENILGDRNAAFTRTSGDAVIAEDGITFGDRSHVVSQALPERQPGEVYETRIRLTLTPSGDTHFYLYNDTEAHNAETGHGVIVMPERSDTNIGVARMRDGEAMEDNRDSVSLPYGDYQITMTDDDSGHRTVITLPSGEERTFLQFQIERTHGGRIFINAGGTEIHELSVLRMSDTTLGDRLAEAEAEAELAQIRFGYAGTPDTAALDAAFAEFGAEDAPVTTESTVIENTAPMEDAPETRLAALRERQAGLQEEINALTMERTDLETLIARKQGVDVRESDALRGENISGYLTEAFSRAEGGAVIDAESITFTSRGYVYGKPLPERQPGETYETRIRLTLTPSDDTHFYMYNDTEARDRETGNVVILMPERDYTNMGVALMEDGETREDHRDSVSLPYGEYLITMTDDDSGHRTVITLPNGEERTFLQSQIERIHDGRIFINAGGTTIHAMEVLRLSAENNAPVEQQTGDLPEMDAAEDINTRKALTDDPRTTTELLSEHARIMEEINALERQKIPYDRMHVTVEGSGFDVRYMSNGTQTYFEVILEGEPGFRYGKTVEHAGGEADGMINLGLPQEGTGRDRVTIMMYADASKSELLDAFEGSYERSTGVPAGGNSWTWGEIDTRRLGENPLMPEMRVLDTYGPMVIVALQSPYNASHLTLDGGGFFGNTSKAHDGGSSYEGHLFAINTDKPAGVYALKMHEGVSGREVCRIEFQWDPESQTLTPIGENYAHISGLADEGSSEHAAELRSMVKAIHELDSTIVSYATLRSVQRSHLFQFSQFGISEAEQEEIIQRFPIADHPDRGSIFKEGVGAWSETIGELLDVAVNVSIDALQGKSQAAGREYFQTQYDVISGNRYLREFLIDFRMEFPSADAIFDEGQRLAQEHIDELVKNNAKNESMIARDNYFANLGGGTEEPVERSQEAINAQLRSIAEAHGTDSEQYRNYVALNGDRTDTTGIANDSTAYGEGFDVVDSEGQELVFGERLAEALEAPTNENTMILVIYGSNQIPGDGADFDVLLQELRNDYQEAWGFSPGYNPTEPGELLGLAPSEAYENIWNFIQSRISNNPHIRNIVLVGHSYGGGMAYLLADKISDEMPNLNIAGTIYVDAVKLLSTTPEDRLPEGTGDVLNIFQSLVSTADYLNEFTNGGRIDAQVPSTRQLIQIDMDNPENNKNNETHQTIDLAAQPHILDFIRSRIRIINYEN